MSSRGWWLLLGIMVGVIAWGLTIWITHVDHTPKPVVTVAFDERPPFIIDENNVQINALERYRERIPEVVFSGPSRVLVLVVAATRSIALRGTNPRDVECGAFPKLVGSAALWVSSDRDVSLPPIPVRAAGPDTVIPVPDSLHAALLRARGAKGVIACKFRRRLAVAPTFTERALTIRADTKSSGAVMINVSALEDVDDLRFSGGLQLPFSGERTRLLSGENNVVSTEWSDVIAQERRDIVLVLIGALSAIAAATIIEALRPWVEGKQKG